MSIVFMPDTRVYCIPGLRFSKITDIMAINCFQKIKHHLHINNNENLTANCAAKLYKIRSLFNTLKEKFQQAIPGEKLGMDDQMVPYNGCSM